MLNRILKRQFVIVPLISAFILICASCRQDYRTVQGETWGTYYKITYASRMPLEDSVKAVLVYVDNEYSLFNSASSVSRINKGETDSVGAEFVALLEMCRQVHEISGGVYDPTVGPLADLWGFGKSEVRLRPTKSAIDSALMCVGLSECRIEDGCRLVKKSPGTIFDFSSIAKGFGIDCIADMFERNGCDNYMIEIGGEISAKGINPRGNAWRIQVDSPASGFGHEALRIVELGPERTALASSGNYRNFINLEDSVFSHTISPLTGYPVKGDMLSATIKTESCAVADALATACMAAATQNAARAIVEKAGVDYLLVSGDSTGKMAVSAKGF